MFYIILAELAAIIQHSMPMPLVMIDSCQVLNSQCIKWLKFMANFNQPLLPAQNLKRKLVMSTTSDPSSTQHRLCKNCHANIRLDSSVCPQCGMACSPVRDGKGKWRGISFPVFVILISIFCAAMILWLPR